MPYMIVSEDDQFCVYKKGEDGAAEGDSMGCHDSKDEAQSQVDALYANEERSVFARLWQKVRQLFAAEAAPVWGDPEIERAMSMSNLFEQTWAAIEAGMNGDSWPWLNDIYRDDDGSLFAIISSAGKLYRSALIVTGNGVTLGEMVPVEVMFTPVVEARMIILRQSDGKRRWFILPAGVAVLNRVGEIDSRALFEAFEAQSLEDAPVQLRFFHDARMGFGNADWVARGGYGLLASGLLDDDNPLADAYADACEQGRGKWGASIGYVPTEPPEMVRVDGDVTIPTYNAGILREISILPETDAASWFTDATMKGVQRMLNERVKAALVTLFGDEERANQEIERLESLERKIEDDKLIARDAGESEADADATTESDAETEEQASEEDNGATTPDTFELTEEAAEALAGRMAGHLQQAGVLYKREEVIEAARGAMAETLGTVNDALNALTANVNKLTDRLAALEATDEQKRQQWQADLPRGQRTVVTYRPKEANGDSAGEPASLADRAAATLEKMAPRK